MTGRQPPTNADLRARLDKRMYIIGKGPVVPSRMPGSTTPSRRFYRPDKILDGFRAKFADNVQKTQGGSSGAVFALNGTAPSVQTGGIIPGPVGASNGTVSQPAGGVNATGTGQGGYTGGVTSGTGGVSNNTFSLPNATAGTGQGVSPAVIAAVRNNTLTKANPPTTSNSLGLDIEGADTGCSCLFTLHFLTFADLAVQISHQSRLEPLRAPS